MYSRHYQKFIIKKKNKPLFDANITEKEDSACFNSW